MKLKVDVYDRDAVNSNDYVDTLYGLIEQTPHPTDTQTHVIRDRCRSVHSNIKNTLIRIFSFSIILQLSLLLAVIGG